MSLMKRSWMKKMKKKKQAPTTHDHVLKDCGVSLWSQMLKQTPIGAVTLALFTQAGAFKDTRRRQCQQLHLSLHGDGVLLTGNFPGSLPDEVVGSTSLHRSICFYSTHGSGEIQGRETKQEKGS